LGDGRLGVVFVACALVDSGLGPPAVAVLAAAAADCSGRLKSIRCGKQSKSSIFFFSLVFFF
jgi:hypothetical protein